MKFSVHPTIRNKPVPFKPEYSRDWQESEGELLDLQNHISKGGAFIPAVMSSNRRSSAAFKSSELAVVDIDHGLTVEAFQKHPLAQYACWVYTTHSHSEKEHRFRVVFRLPQVVTSAELYKAITTILIRSLGGDRACSDACRLYYGNDMATHPIWQPKAVLSDEILEEARKEAELQRARFDASAAEFEEDDILRAIFCLEEIIEPTADGEREPKFLPITMACNRVGGAIFPAWSDWAFRGYHGKKNGQCSQRYFDSSKSSKHTLGTIFHHANLDNPNWRDLLPEELKLRGEYNPAAGKAVVGYEHSEFLGEDGIYDMTYEEYAAAMEKAGTATQSLFDSSRPWTYKPKPIDYDSDPFADFELEDDDDEPVVKEKRGPGRPRKEDKEAPEDVARRAIEFVFQEVRYNTTAGQYEYGPRTDPKILSGDEIDRAYLNLNEVVGGSFPKQLAKDLLCMTAEKNRYSPVVAYLNHCAANAKPIDYFDKIASTLMGSPEEGPNNPRMDSGQLFHDAIMQRFFVGAVARALDPGCTHDWMPVLIGSQACGKTSFLQYITPPHKESNRYEWCATIQQDLTTVANRPHKLHAGWIVVLDECERYFVRRHVEQLKNLVSTSTDRSDLKYRNEMNFVRTFVLAGACNSSDFLTDPTGNRRFMPVKIEGIKSAGAGRSKVIDLDRVKRDRDGIWAAAFRAYQDNPVHTFDSGELAQVSEYVENFAEENPLESLVLNFCAGEISGKRLYRGKDQRYWKVPHLLAQMDVPVVQHMAMTRQITDILKRHGFERMRYKEPGTKNPVSIWTHPDR